ncbi:MAG: LytR family transcriptional regulator [Frankiales bacterium]|nr:LytR family transcriptional regulator [Frankiales bacterium]
MSPAVDNDVRGPLRARAVQALVALGSVVALVYSVVGWRAAEAVGSTGRHPQTGASGLPNQRPAVTQGIPTESRAPQTLGRAMNVLVLGTDSREGLTAAEIAKYHLGSEGSNGSDTMMLIHLAADGEHATILSLPRDLWVEIPAFEGKSAVHLKINAAYARGGVQGPNLALYTVERLTGIHIDHYMSINVPGLGKMVDALGGVDVCLPQAVNDTMYDGKPGGSGLVLPAGYSHLDGVQAVAYVRTRHKDTGDGPEDFGRIRRQQKFVASILSSVMSTGTLANPIKLTRIIDAVAPALTLDDEFDGAALFDIASGLQGLNTSRVMFVTVPVADANYHVDGQWAMKMDDEAAGRIFDDIIHDRLVTPEPTATASATATSSSAASPSATTGSAAAGVHTAADDPCARSTG